MADVSLRDEYVVENRCEGWLGRTCSSLSFDNCYFSCIEYKTLVYGWTPLHSDRQLVLVVTVFSGCDDNSDKMFWLR